MTMGQICDLQCDSTHQVAAELPPQFSGHIRHRGFGESGRPSRRLISTASGFSLPESMAGLMADTFLSRKCCHVASARQSSFFWNPPALWQVRKGILDNARGIRLNRSSNGQGAARMACLSMLMTWKNCWCRLGEALLRRNAVPGSIPATIDGGGDWREDCPRKRPWGVALCGIQRRGACTPCRSTATGRDSISAFWRMLIEKETRGQRDIPLH